ncbi:nucleolar protein 9-like [Notothenia coriiceps]|uniref:Nucleolar protein 9-like n=1 Tax=Notothenia coriiceps TaxID=8208 RepID=A0A6I9MYU4_9TELE|nr:PREDICTED: nucleolar protein 9-like [Notothenia coriiceps]
MEHYELHRDFIYPVLTVSAFDRVSLQGQFVPMACSRLGSRVLEAVWNSASVTHRHNIAQELVSCDSRLRSDQFARHVWAKFALSHYIHRRGHWQEIQSGESKKRKLFSDILE